MTTADRWLLPDGVIEILPPEAERLEHLRRRLLDLYGAWGYQFVVPPLIEYLESLLIGAGKDLELQTFKLTDQLTGRMMGVRADITPQVARIDAHCLQHASTLSTVFPSRLCYAGSVLHCKPAHLLASRTLIQTGVELYGHSGVESDVEVINVMLDTLAAAQCGTVLVNLGHVGIVSGLLNATGLSENLKQELFDIYQRKDVTGLESFIFSHVQDSQLAEMLGRLIQLSGGSDVLAKAKQLLKSAPEGVLAGIDRLEQIVVRVNAYHRDAQFYFDLGEMHSYNYHTGVVFSAFQAGSGEELALGGRYDHIGEAFGRARPATGFSADLLKLLKLSSFDLASRGLIYAPADSDPELREEIRKLRQQGKQIVSALSGDTATPAQLGCRHQICKQGNAWTVVDVTVVDV